MPPRLKSLELHGYKTFASRTNFAFPGVITAIVGPNGSGKSNIADALRWVLGEQSYILLRGRKTEDMIFSGSEQRSRAGMASATITFDNDDGWLPIDFSEVAITRRAYRDGQNEYLINGQRVRLREISELLAQSGLAERTYTIIGQGLVDAALALKPEERRRLFEEAAGIGLYRSRREEALNRLVSTNRNLERVQDIIAELEPRLKSLERQAKRAQEYENLKSDLHILLRDWYGYHWLQTQREAKRTADILHQHEEHVDVVLSKRNAMTEEMSELRRQITDARSHLNELHSQAASLHSQLERTSRSLAILEERKRSNIDLIQSMQHDLARLESEIDDRRERLLTSGSEKNRLASELLDNQNRLSAAKKSLEVRLKQRSEAEAELNTSRQSLVQIETRIVRQNARKNELEERMAALKASLSSVRQSAEAARGEAEKFERQLSEAVAKVKSANDQRRQIGEHVQNERAKLAEAEADYRRQLAASAKTEGDLARLRAQLDVLEQAQKSFSGLSEGAKFLLETQRQGKISGRTISVSSMLEVPVELEKAVTAALGEYLDLVMLQKGSSPEPILEMLLSTDKGRAAILPEEWIRIPDGFKLIDDRDCLGLASELVKCSSENKNLMQAVLGQTVIVRNRTAARRVLETLPAGAKSVTLDGEVFLATGAVVSGRIGKGGNSQFSRPRQIRELEEQVKTLALSASEDKTRIQKLDANLQERREALKKLEKQSIQAAGEAEKVLGIQRSVEMNLEQTRRQIEWLEKQQRQTEAQEASLINEIQVTTSGAEAATKEVETLRAAVHTANLRLVDLPADEHRSEVAHWETTNAVTRRAFTEEEKRYLEIEKDVNQSQNNAESIRSRIHSSNEILLAINVESEGLHRDEERLSVEVNAIHTAAAPEEADLGKLEAEMERLQGDDLASQQELTLAERHYTQAQLEASKARENAESIRRRAEEDFGLVSFNGEEAPTRQEPLPLEGLVEKLPALEILPNGIDENLSRVRAQMRRLGAINPEALNEYNEVQSRYQFMKAQVSDLRAAEEDLHQVITELDELMRREFRKTFDAVATEFKQMFTRLFGGGNARLVLTDEEQPIEAGIDIEARLPGRREQGLSLLSGGERSLAAVALVFSLLKVSPTPFCVLDEVDAMLDEANVGRFRDLLRELSQTTQFIVITHNRNTVQAADVIYGVTMGRDSASQVISLKLEEVPQEMAQ